MVLIKKRAKIFVKWPKVKAPFLIKNLAALFSITHGHVAALVNPLVFRTVIESSDHRKVAKTNSRNLLPT